MYAALKRLVLGIIPRQSLFRYEYQFRFFYALGFRGKKFECNICRTQLSKFIGLKDDRLCPRCGSLQRTRRLWQIMNEGFLQENSRILDFSPSRSLYRVLKGYPNYLSSDLSGDFLAQVAYDITQIEAKDKSFDLILCYHILEHIEEDIKAMQELYRVLDTGGYCLIQTPFKEGAIYEDYSIKTPELREKHFGQDDHVRIYSIEGLKERLESVGFKVERRDFKPEPDNFHGFGTEETVLLCSKV